MVLYRKSRLHDEKGNIAPVVEILRFPYIIFQAVMKKVLGYFPQAPIIPYTAQQKLDSLMHKRMRVIEFGSGQSTLWYSKRCGEIYSHETTDKWFDKVSDSLQKHNCQNATLTRWDGISFTDEIKTPAPDLIIVDGINRVLCTEYAIKHAKDGTWIYLDNSDKDMSSPSPDREMRVCETLLLNFSSEEKRKVEYFTGFAPAQAFAEQGMLIHPKSNNEEIETARV